MPLFEVEGNRLQSVEQMNFSIEKKLQTLIEKNLETVFNCRFVASEFSTGPLHAGRIDSLALSEENNPVIVEYKKVESSALINQSLYYLHWIQDHGGDFEMAARRALGDDVKVDWTDIRVIGTGNTEFTVSTQEEFEQVKPFIELAYNKVGG